MLDAVNPSPEWTDTERRDVALQLTRKIRPAPGDDADLLQGVILVLTGSARFLNSNRGMIEKLQELRR